MRNANEAESGRVDESRPGESQVTAESNGLPEEKAVGGKRVEAAQSSPATVSQPLARDLYDWASRLTAEAGGSEEYYWTPQMERLVTKLKVTKRALIGVVGVQGAGKTAAMYAVRDCVAAKDCFGWERVIAVKVAETGGFMDTVKSTFGVEYDDRVNSYVKEYVEDEISSNRAFLHKAQRVVNRECDQDSMEQFWAMHRGRDVKGRLSPVLRNLVPRRVVREREAEALESLVEQQRVFLIDMPDYPKHDRRLIARDLNDIQGVWNRLMTDPDLGSDASIVVFIQKETFNHADHFLYGKMDLIDLMPLTVSQLLEAYKQKWGGYEPFAQDALEYVARMSRGVFRRFKRYIALAVETRVTQAKEPDAPIDLELVKKGVTDEEVMRDMDKELDGIFRKSEQKQKALELIKLLSDMRFRRTEAKAAGAKSLGEFMFGGEPLPDGFNQAELAGKLDLSEMAVSRLVRELQQHGYVKRTAWRQWTYVDMNW